MMFLLQRCKRRENCILFVQRWRYSPKANVTKIDRVISGVNCYPLSRLNEIVEERKISIAIVTVPAASAIEVTDQLVEAGITGIMNFTTVPLNLPEECYLEEYDMITSLEKVAYFVKTAQA